MNITSFPETNSYNILITQVFFFDSLVSDNKFGLDNNIYFGNQLYNIEKYL